MPFRNIDGSLRDIVDAIGMIEQFTANPTWEGPARRDIRWIGNWLRHQYDAVELEVVWETMIADLPALKAAVLHALVPPPAIPKKPALG